MRYRPSVSTGTIRNLWPPLIPKECQCLRNAGVNVRAWWDVLKCTRLRHAQCARLTLNAWDLRALDLKPAMNVNIILAVKTFIFTKFNYYLYSLLICYKLLTSYHSSAFYFKFIVTQFTITSENVCCNKRNVKVKLFELKCATCVVR